MPIGTKAHLCGLWMKVAAVLILCLSQTPCSGQDALTCHRAAEQLTRCPAFDNVPSGSITKEWCEMVGCYFCDAYIPIPINLPCVEGTGCGRIDLSYEHECKKGRRRIARPQECWKEGCSWCARQSRFKCIKNVTSLDEIIAQPPFSSQTCDLDPPQTQECEYLVPAKAGDRMHCWASGCHWCSSHSPPCIQGHACSPEKTTGEYDCRNSLDEELTPYQCRRRGCSWCPNNARFRCVRDQPVGKSDLTCRRTDGEMVECPGPSGRTEQECREDGCYYCDGRPVPCVQGTGCSRISISWRDACMLNGRPIQRADKCREEGCSWCNHHAQIKCVKNVNDEKDIVSVPPILPDNCAIDPSLRKECPYEQPILAGTQMQCWASGCHWCPSVDEPFSCIQGEVCGVERNTPEYDCRDYPTEVLSPYQCGQRGCSWCEDNAAYKCVRDVPDAAQVCTGSESLFCFPYPTLNGVTEEQCNDEYRCSYCGSSSNENQCMMRDRCPHGQQLRYDQKSCCRNAEEGDPNRTPASGPRIINGNLAQEGQWPALASFRFSGDWFNYFICSAAMITSQIAVTAAHCQPSDGSGRIIPLVDGFLVVGSIDRFAGTEISVLQIKPHPWYSPGRIIHDVMLVMLQHDVPPEVKPISLPLGELPRAGMTCFVAGWGVTNTGFPSQFLLEAAVEYLTPDQCATVFSIYDELFEICAGGTLQATCFGDSGGPLMCQRCSSCAWYALGVVSYGLTLDCNPAVPSFYAYLGAYYDFFAEHGVPIENKKYSCDESV